MRLFTHVQKAVGAPHGAPVILVHGSWGSSMMWMVYTTLLSQKGWSVYALDLRGHGTSEGDVRGATMDDYVSDVRQVSAEYDLKQPIVIGHSMGALVTLIYAATHSASAVVAIDPSPSKEVQGAGEKKDYPPAYSPMDAGMPAEAMEVMKAFPDIPQETLMKMKGMLGMESGVARSERKLGVSIPKEKLLLPTLFVGAEHGESVPFGIGIKTARAMADYYEKEVVEIQGASHPGTLLGTHAMEAAEKIEAWMSAL